MKGEIELTIVFLGLSCDILLVVANINSSVDIVTVSEPIEHSVVVRGPHVVGNSSVDIVTVPV